MPTSSKPAVGRAVPRDVFSIHVLNHGFSSIAPGPRSAPRTAQKRIQSIDNAAVFAGEGSDRRAQKVAWNIRDLKRIEHDLSVADHEMRSNITVGQRERLRGHQRHDDPPDRVSESVGLNDDHEGNHALVSTRVPVNTELIGH